MLQGGEPRQRGDIAHPRAPQIEVLQGGEPRQGGHVAHLRAPQIEVLQGGKPCQMEPRSTSLTCVPHRSRYCRAVSPDSGPTSLTCVPLRSRCCRAVSPARGDRLSSGSSSKSNERMTGHQAEGGARPSRDHCPGLFLHIVREGQLCWRRRAWRSRLAQPLSLLHEIAHSVPAAWETKPRHPDRVAGGCRSSPAQGLLRAQARRQK